MRRESLIYLFLLIKKFSFHTPEADDSRFGKLWSGQLSRKELIGLIFDVWSKILANTGVFAKKKWSHLLYIYEIWSHIEWYNLFLYQEDIWSVLDSRTK